MPFTKYVAALPFLGLPPERRAITEYRAKALYCQRFISANKFKNIAAAQKRRRKKQTCKPNSVLYCHLSRSDVSAALKRCFINRFGETPV